MGSSLQGRIIAPVMLVTALAVALSAFLNYGKFVRTFTEIEGSRFAFVADDIRSVIEGGMDLGVPLPALVAAQAIIEQEAAKDANIQGIVLFDDAGQVLFRTGQGVEAVPPAWLAALRSPDAHWSGSSADTLVAGSRLSNDIRQTVGGVAVLYSRERHDELTGRIARDLALGALTVALAAGVIAYLGVSLLVHRLRRQIGRMQAVLDGDDSAFSSPEPRRARETAAAALQALAATESELERAGATPRP